MQEELIRTYKEIMESLAALPNEIYERQMKINAVQQQADSLQADMDNREAGYKLEWKELGSNDTIRKARLTEILDNDDIYQRTLRELQKVQRSLTTMQNDLDRRQKMFSAVCYQARLHSSLLTFLGNSMEGVKTNALGEVDFGMKTARAYQERNITSGPSSNGTPTAANLNDMADLLGF
ncbi:hypothetical protein GC175_17175 [bacterium]|nr:hypothetical protein [bacterium]